MCGNILTPSALEDNKEICTCSIKLSVPEYKEIEKFITFNFLFGIFQKGKPLNILQVFLKFKIEDSSAV